MRIRRHHNLGVEEARNRADRVAADLQQQFSLTSQWQGDALLFIGNVVSGQLHVVYSQFELNVNLVFALKLMEVPILSVI